MPQPYPTPERTPAAIPQRAAKAIAVGGVGLGIAALLAALALWFHYGTAVFFETITAGISACF